MMGELRGEGEVLKLGQDALPEFTDCTGSVLETPGNDEDLALLTWPAPSGMMHCL